jgi:hypothetical protein
MIVVNVVAAGAAGIVFWNALAGRFEGVRLERSLRIPVGLMAVLYSYDVAGPRVCGFLSGSAAQGLTWRDWYLLVSDKGKGEEVYARWRP